MVIENERNKRKNVFFFWKNDKKGVNKKHHQRRCSSRGLGLNLGEYLKIRVTGPKENTVVMARCSKNHPATIILLETAGVIMTGRKVRDG